jgi:hypothetical protein
VHLVVAGQVDLVDGVVVEPEVAQLHQIKEGEGELPYGEERAIVG